MTDNARKIFEMLGIKPNEKFKVERSTFEYCYIDENLEIHVSDFDDEFSSIIWFTKILNGEYKITKLPKKKKLRDLTEEEYKEWCDANKCYRCYGSNNSKCIFMNVPCNSRLGDCWIYNKDLYSDKFLDQEIEVK